MTIDINLKKNVDDSYKIYIGDLGKLKFDSKTAIVTNDTVADLYLDELRSLISAPQVGEVIIKDGEQYKNLDTIAEIVDRLCELRLDRQSTLIAFGGGVIGDMTGFCAAIYQRGISFVQIPTTLLAMVDASVGGKTGVNNVCGKNMIGSFNQPKSVRIDTKWLKTLPKREFSAGVAEIVKMAATLDSDFFARLESANLNNETELTEAIAQSIRIKADIVMQDEKESGARAVLNYGHTFGHAIEKESGYGAYLHGECVAMGMIMANNLAVSLGALTQNEADRIDKTLRKFGLTARYKTPSAENFYASFFLDKKTLADRIYFALPRGIGSYVFVNDAPKNLVIDAIIKGGE
ncbi:MAG: 3-dehydroquinate synthase [Helicobacteraceae bacterium]|jgi:3-dehydroquinate synthase|nr:3-dehydroquinate synthase [Helicobacteraceae bacterium]